MVPKLTEIKDMLHLQEVLNDFYYITDISVELYDEELNSLDQNSKLQLEELDINKEFIEKLDSNSSCIPIKLHDQSMIIVVPIKAFDRRVASIIAGRFTMEEQEVYIKGVPVISNEKFKALGGFISKLVGLINKMFYERMIKVEKDKKMAEDIIEIKQMKEKIQQENEFNKTIIENMSEGLCVCHRIEDFPYLKFTNWNQQMTNITGYTMEEINKLGWYQAMYADLETQERAVERIKETTEGKHTFGVEREIVRADGTKRIFSMTSTSFKSIDNSIHVMGIMRDITERKKIEDDLKQSEEKYRSLVEILPDAVFVRTEDKIVFANNETAQLFGAKKPEDIIGRKLSEIAVVDDNYNKEKRRKNFSKRLINGRIPLTEQKLYSFLNNRDIYVEITAAYYPMNNKDCWLVAARDISERKRLNETVIEKTKLLNDALEYDRLKTEFMANISHELRTPINVILSALQMVNININRLNIDDETIKVKKYLSMMRQNSYRLIRLINNLIDITKIDSGYYKLNITNCNIVSIVEEITLSVAEYAKNKGLDLVFDTELEEMMLACDPDKIERIILNLLSNAIKFTPYGGNISVKISEDNEQLVITVQDTGIGVPSDKQKQIFDRFVQVDKSLSRNCEGSGIGLSLVKSLVQLHGGQIYLESEYGKGSVFIIRMPIVTVDREESLKTADYNIGSNVERINVEFSDIYM